MLNPELAARLDFIDCSEDTPPSMGGIESRFVCVIGGITLGLHVGAGGVDTIPGEGALEGGVIGAGEEGFDEDEAGHGTLTQTCSTFGRCGIGDAGV